MFRRVLFLMVVSLAVSAAWCAPREELLWEADGAPAKAGRAEVSILRVQEKQRLLVEVRTVLGALGWSLEWNPNSQTMTARQGQKKVTMKVGDPVATVNGKRAKMPSPPRMLWDKMYVPLRFAVEATGCKTEFLGDSVRLTRRDGAVVLVHLLG